MTYSIVVPTQGCVALMNSIQDVFVADDVQIEHNDPKKKALITVTILSEEMDQLFISWCYARGFCASIAGVERSDWEEPQVIE